MSSSFHDRFAGSSVEPVLITRVAVALSKVALL
jgi:hypothetical protein